MTNPSQVNPGPLRCSICNQTQVWHEEHRPHHAFQLEGARFQLASTPASPQTPATGRVTPADPILRLLLIRKGLVTADELTDLEEELKSAGVVLSHSPDMGESRVGGSDRGRRQEPVAKRGMRDRGTQRSAKDR